MGENKVKQMTTQEAIQGLKNLFSEHELDLPNMDSLEVFHIAIEALEKMAGIERILEQLEQQIEEHKNIVTEYDEYNKGKLEAYEHSLELLKNCFDTEQ